MHFIPSRQRPAARSRLKTLTTHLAPLLLLAAFAPRAEAAATPLAIDPAFNSGAPVTLSLATDQMGSYLATQSDGKLVVAGYSWVGGSHTEFTLARYNTDGTPDATFGSGGIVTTPIGTDSAAYAVTVQGDGKLLVAGWSKGTSIDFALARYTSSGSLDATFGSGGTVSTPIGFSQDEATALAVQGDGKIVVAGSSWNGSNWDFGVARYDANGTLDGSFGSGGTLTTSFGASEDRATAVVVQSDGKVVVAGDADNVVDSEFALARYNSDGSLDGSFGSGGKVTSSVGASIDHATAIALQNDGQLVVAGRSRVGATYDFALARYNAADGSLDASFGSGGKVLTAIGADDDEIYALAIQSDGKLVASGRSHNGSNRDFALVRYTSVGGIDALWLGDAAQPVAATAVVIHADGNIAAVGDGSLARYLAPVQPASHFSVSAPAGATAGTAVNVTVTALDPFNNVDTTYAGTVHFTSSDGAALLPADATLTLGTGSFPVTFKSVGNRTVTATDTITTAITGTSGNVAVSAGAATHFSVTAPASATAGTAVNLTVTALDAFNNVDTAYAGTVHFASSDGAALLPADATLTLGTGTFPVTLKSSGNQSVTATDTVTAAITGTSGSIAVSAGAATHFTVTASATATAGTAVNVTVTALDGFNNVATAYSGMVHFTSSDGAAVLPADATLTSGTGSFPVTFKSVGNQSVTATDTVTAALTGTSGNVAVSAGAATHFSVTAPATAMAGTAVNVTVTALDGFNNVATAYSGTVHFTSSDGAALLPADATLTSGTGSFPVTFNTAGNQSVTASDTVTAAITGTSGPVTVAATAVPLLAPAALGALGLGLFGLGAGRLRRRAA